MAQPVFSKCWQVRPPRASVCAPLRAWLTDPASLTRRIRARCGVFAVKVLCQRLARVHRDEAALFGLHAGECAWVREVVLIADGRPVVFARTVLPRCNVRGAWKLFHGIGSQPLGAALFADPRIVRERLTCARLDVRDARYHRALAAGGGADEVAALWARRSIFRLHGRGLLVTEVFLPAILAMPE